MAMTDSSFVDDNVLIPGPSFRVELAALDARHPVHYSRRLLIFRCTSPANRDVQLAALKTGLRALVARCPILGGTVAPLPPDEASDSLRDWRTVVPGPGLELVVRDLRSAMHAFDELAAAEFPPLQFPYDLLVPVPDNLTNDRPFAACKVQFSAIQGGTVLAWAMSHSVADGAGTNELLRLLSEETRLAQSHSSDALAREPRSENVGQDRSVLRNITSDIPFTVADHPAYAAKTSAPPADASPAPPHPFRATVPEVPVLLRIPPSSLAQLKADATTPGAPPISTHDALSALLWRSVLLVRSQRPGAHIVPASTIASVFMPSDARRHLGLPSAYVGNAVYQLTAALELGALLAPAPAGLQRAAGSIRRAIAAVDPARVASYMAALREEWVEWGFAGAASTTGAGMGTDWTSGALYGDDWGAAFGPLVRYRYPGEATKAILPKLPDGGAELIVGVMPDEVDLLRSDDCFGKYIEAR